MKSKIFISYSRKDLDFARRIVSTIKEKTGIVPWIDFTGIESGKQFLEVIISAIDSSKVMVCLLSEDSIQSPYVRKELTYAINTGKKIFLLEIERIEIPDWLWSIFDGKYYLPWEEERMIGDLYTHILHEEEYHSPESINGYGCVDLGLSVLWATCNLGAITPDQPGDYYAWGEKTPRSSQFNEGSYLFCFLKKGLNYYKKYNLEDLLLNLDDSDDAVRQAWGDPWRMPRRKEMEELLDNCVLTYIDGPLEALGGQHVRGCLATSRINRNSIFLPITGLKAEWDHDKAPTLEDDNSGLYWTSTHSSYISGTIRNERNVNVLKINCLEAIVESDAPICRRFNGLCIRPVADLHPCIPTKRTLLSNRSRRIRSEHDVFISYLDPDRDAFRDVFSLIDRETDIRAVSSQVDDRYENKESAVQALKRCRVAVFILSLSSARSSEMRKRIHYAQEKQKVIIPVWVDIEDPTGWVLFELEPDGIIRYTDSQEMSRLASLFKAMSEIKYPDLSLPSLYRSPLGPYSEGLASFYENRRWGFRDKSGKIAIQPQFVNVSVFKDGVAVAGTERRFGIIDSKGRFVRYCDEYNRMSSFSDGLSAVVYKEKKGYIDRTGKLVISATWDLSEGFAEGRALVMKDGKWGFIDKNGNVVVPIRYDDGQSFSEGYAAVMDDNNRWGFIDTQGRTVIEHLFRYACPFNEGKAYVVDDTGPLFIDKKGKRCFETAFTHRARGSCFCCGRALVADQKDEDWYIDEQGLFIEKPDGYEGFQPFSEGLAVIAKDDKAGFIDTTGHLVIECIYDGADSFHEGFAVVRIGNEYFYIDRNGEIVPGLGKQY